MISIHITLLFDKLSSENIISEYLIPSTLIEILSFFALWHLYFIRESLEDY